MNNYRQLKQKISSKQAKICVVGLGYVGLPLVVNFAKKGFFVYGLDTNISRIDKLKQGKKYIIDIVPEDVLKLIKKNKFFPTDKKEILKDSDIIIICVPTPLRKVKTPDISFVKAAAKTVKKQIRPGQLIILESTSYPTTTREVVLPELKKSGLCEEKDFFLCFSPERVNPGDKLHPITKIPKLVGGLSSQSTQLAKALYSQIIKKVHPVSNPEVAETSKLLENTYRLVNIALISEFTMVAEKLGINIWEVIAAASTKPFGFMSFYPGPGIGGHCLGGKEFIYIKSNQGIEVITLNDFVKKVIKEKVSLRKNLFGTEYIKPNSDYKMMTFDAKENKVVFKPIDLLSKRKTEDDLFKITTAGNRKLVVTDKHPMFVTEDDKLKIKFAHQLKIGESLPFILKSKIKNEKIINPEIDLIKELSDYPELTKKIRIRPKNFSWKQIKDKVYQLNFKTKYYTDYIRYNFLPFEYFLQAEARNIFKVNHKDLYLCSGRGPSFNQIPAVLEVDNDFCRLLGYYLSEGCLTKDKSFRVRFCFNSNEKEYIYDVCNLLKKLEIKYSLYNSKIWKSSYIKVSSNIFGFLINDILKCGKDCYDMNIPSKFLELSSLHIKELLKGILRGDGGVDLKTGKHHYKKNGKSYYHHRNTCGINYFSSSKKLFQQVVYILQDFGIAPTFKKREGLLYIFGYKQINKLKDIFLGEKLGKIQSYLNNNRKVIAPKGFCTYNNFASSKIKFIQKIKGNYVYSAEVKDTHTIVTSYGTIVHNCIPCDPKFLSWKSKKLGFKTKMVDLASYMNHFMPQYVINRVEKALGKKKIANTKILILGITYKKGVKDLRESPALDIIEKLQKIKTKVDYYDPLIPYLDINDIQLKRAALSAKNIKKYNCVIVVTDHSKVNYAKIQKNAKLIFDTRNVYKRNYKNVVRL